MNANCDYCLQAELKGKHDFFFCQCKCHKPMNKIQQAILRGQEKWKNGFWKYRVPKNTKQFKDISDFLAQHDREVVGAVLEEVRETFESFLLRDWSGEAEVYSEIERLKTTLLDKLGKEK